MFLLHFCAYLNLCLVGLSELLNWVKFILSLSLFYEAIFEIDGTVSGCFLY